ncbi:transglycosylase domain-containing protein [Jannaschia sp. KMU-145]|uniref:transglycosylase domain-containing protein n=1 Tax=Jannaschia halovivens TaxID=3388667 RepID=UPI00396B026E
MGLWGEGSDKAGGTRPARNPLALSTKAARYGAVAVLAGLAILALPVGRGYLDGRAVAPDHAARADALIAEGRGGDALGEGRLDRLLEVQDPGFHEHRGIDLATPGAGITTMTQSLAKRVGFEEFQPGWAKLRQSGLAMGYETGMTKAQIAALWLETVEMGPIEGQWRIGFFDAAEVLHDRPVAALTNAEFADLTARLIAPGALGRDTEAREERVARILRLWAGDCAPTGPRDVWLEGCA